MGYQVEKMSREDIDWIYSVAALAGWHWYLHPRQSAEVMWLGGGFTVDRAAGSFMLWLARRREMPADHYLFHCNEWTLHLWQEDHCEYSVEDMPAGPEDNLEQARVLVEKAFQSGGWHLTGKKDDIFAVPANGAWYRLYRRGPISNQVAIEGQARIPPKLLSSLKEEITAAFAVFGDSGRGPTIGATGWPMIPVFVAEDRRG
ncbi:hypothetical protein ACN9MU_04750 [Pseudoduganella sp. R-32]|uniref:hypothetical protein n=1 Tax=Pseudoduganella sp. R-32 TaxID=3404061 RepID=UPI003CE8BB03